LILLLDTHLLLWAAGEPERLSEETRTLLRQPENDLVFSAASMWEISIKNALGRDDFRVDPRRLWRMLLTHGYGELAVSAEHTVAVGKLPPLHKDPFDRMLVAQAKTEAITLLTADARVAAYGEPVWMA
jgi:PIN domain nuclease of toxin-antitoxin system